jgi:hypothetical protein
MQQTYYAVAIVLVMFVAVVIAGRGRNANEEARPIEFARIVSFAGTNAGVGIGGLMLAIFCFVSLMEYASATTVFQQISALLIWIGDNTFCGVLIIAGMISSQAKTYVVYSDIALRMENNIARLEKLQEQASSINAVADAVKIVK